MESGHDKVPVLVGRVRVVATAHAEVDDVCSLLQLVEGGEEGAVGLVGLLVHGDVCIGCDREDGFHVEGHLEPPVLGNFVGRGITADEHGVDLVVRVHPDVAPPLRDVLQIGSAPHDDRDLLLLAFEAAVVQ